LAGCNMQHDAVDNGNENLVKVQNTAVEDVDRDTGKVLSRHLVDLAKSVPNVKDATAVVLGKYAIVGIDVDANLERSEVGTIKYSVAESLKHDPHGARAIVVADPDLTARIKEIAADIRNNQPITGIMNELSDITGRLMPEVPADMIDPKPSNVPEKQKKNISNQDRQNLEKEQDDQSKNMKD
jgi:YhcN/YlaJ family sporulation lipoprotein